MEYTWTNLETDVEIVLTSEKMRGICDTLGIYPDQLADILTGYNCDSYADMAEEIATNCDGNATEALDYDKETYERCRAYHRIMNISLTDEECEICWIEDFEESGK